MANQNVRIPRFYTDIAAYLLSRGMTFSTNIGFADDTVSHLTTLTTGSAEELFDLRPLNKVTFDTSSNQAKNVVLHINTSSFKKGFVAILNHNMKSADAKFLVKTSDNVSHVKAIDMASANAMGNPVEITNADDITNSIVTPATDGHTIVTFDETDDTFVGIQFEGTDSNNFDGTNDLFVGCVMVGEFFDMPFAPDLNLTRSIEFDKVTQNESLGGQRFSTMTSFGRRGTTTTKSPFNNESFGNKVYGGRIIYDMNFSYMDSTDIMPNEMDASNLTDDAVVEDVWNRTNGPHLPFIFSVDNTSKQNDAEADHLFARFGQSGLIHSQVAPDVFNLALRIEEEF